MQRYPFFPRVQVVATAMNAGQSTIAMGLHYEAINCAHTVSEYEA